jgi:hypothetical protein
VLEDVLTVNTNTSGYSYIGLNPNGAIAQGTPTEVVAQPRIWNQYAAMYDFY